VPACSRIDDEGNAKTFKPFRTAELTAADHTGGFFMPGEGQPQ